jgi:hypothetical protein
MQQSPWKLIKHLKEGKNTTTRVDQAVQMTIIEEKIEGEDAANRAASGN